MGRIPRWLAGGLPSTSGRTPVLDEPIFAAFGATDFRPQLASLQKNGASGVFVAVYGDDGIAFYRQALESDSLAGASVIADSYNEFLVPLAMGGSTPVHLWLAMTWYYGGYTNLPVSRRFYDEVLLRTGNGLPSGLVCPGHAAVHAFALAIGRTGSMATEGVIGGLRGLTFDTAKGPITFRPEDHQAICDVNFVRIKSDKTTGLDMVDSTRSDIEVAEFVRYDGASVIEPASPGKALIHHA